MGWRTRCPHNSDKAPVINAADDYSNVAVGGQKRSLQAASGTMPFSALVSALTPSNVPAALWKIERVRANQAYKRTLFPFYSL
jgi:hypothetical protein